MSRRVLFVSHEASRSGAPLVLLRFLRWLSGNSDIAPVMLFARGGELTPDFAQIGPVLTLDGDSTETRAPLRLLRRLGSADRPFAPLPAGLSLAERAVRVPARGFVLRDVARRIEHLGQPELIYVNSVYAAAALPLLPKSIPVIAHVHELGYSLRLCAHFEPHTVGNMMGRANYYVAASGAVAAALVDELGIDPARIAVCHSFIPTDTAPLSPVAVSAARAELGLPLDALVVGSVGTVEWNKGPDLFIQVAKRTLETVGKDHNVVFVWVGRPATWGDWWEGQTRHDVERAGLADRVRFVGARRDPAPIMSLFDLFLLPSRSDAFPLVCLEAAALGKPIVCFDAGGMTELLLPEERLVVPYLDVDGMAARVSQLLCSGAERRELGEALGRRVRARHRVEHVAPVILDRIDRALKGSESWAS